VSRLFFILLLLSASLSLADNTTSPEQDKKLQALQSRIANLQKNLQSTQGKKQHFNKRLKESEIAISKLARSLRILSDRLSRKKKKLKSLKKQESIQLIRLKQEQVILEKQVRSAFLMGRQEQIKLLFNQQDPEKISRMMIYYEYINRERIEKLKVIKKRISSLRTVQDRIVKEEAKIHKIKQSQFAEKDLLIQSQIARKEVVKSISKELAQGNKALKQLRLDEKQLGKLIAGVQEVIRDINYDSPKEKPFRARKGKIPWPAKGRITHSFGTSRIGNLRWEGTMISAPEGNNVKSVHGGRIAYADWLRGFGLLIIIDHGQGYMTLYGHNQTIFKEAGDWVEANEQIALVGSSGGQDKSGVYFAIRKNGKPVNPVKWCQRPKGKRVG